MYPTQREPLISTQSAPLAPLAADALLAVWRRFALSAPPDEIDFPGVSRASVDERRGRILDALRTGSRVSFRSLAGQTVDQVVATFLAVLELFRRGQVSVEQEAPFGDIILSLRTSSRGS
jgi:chromatin segregation and condensation protein Rec8/ScpA/Scc1 (kleisin family)